MNLENYNKIYISELSFFFIIQENEEAKDKLYTEELQKQPKTFLGFRNGAPEACKTMCFYGIFFKLKNLKNVNSPFERNCLNLFILKYGNSVIFELLN